jgi:hypothetical protein
LEAGELMVDERVLSFDWLKLWAETKRYGVPSFLGRSYALTRRNSRISSTNPNVTR